MSIQTSSNASKSWKDWFNSRPSASFINKSHQERLFKTFDSSVSVEKIKSNIESHEETAFLFHQNFGQGRVSIFHHLKTIGGNIYVEKEESAFIQGVEEGTSCIMIPDYSILTAVPQVTAESIPTTVQLLAVSSVEEVNALVNGNTTSYKPRNFVPVPPFLLNRISTFISKSEGNAKELLVEVAAGIKEFDTIHQNDDEYLEKAKSKSKDILT
jgi:hypothetical protein